MKTLGTLMSDAFAISGKFFMPILVGAIVFGILFGGARIATQQWVGAKTQDVMDQIGIDQNRLQAIQERARSGDPEAAQELAAEMANLANQFQGGEAVALASGILGTGMRGAIAGVFLAWLLMSTALAYFLLVPGKGSDAGALWQETGRSILPMLGLNLWLFLRLFLWIPFIGFIVAIVLGPRFALAPVILLTEKKGVFDSARMSYQRTKGQWGKIFGNGLVVGIVCVVLGMVVALFTGPLGGIVGGIVYSIISMILMAYSSIFLHELSVTVSGAAKTA
ncbi:MAG: hypothetical protein V1926_00905 [Candidatus Peregrinibacteria bacterium]